MHYLQSPSFLPVIAYFVYWSKKEIKMSYVFQDINTDPEVKYPSVSLISIS